ncbi:uncharacterized protein BJX67DRAFT_361540 [Aspergillus lucknowensis]|uniref:NAD-dependent epimerase/dehydratase domain-containing protein n=1 Tax=Aspergillus lucknowensis TaxID=176173 RepID=A0ABR4LIP0_9EURO
MAHKYWEAPYCSQHSCSLRSMASTILIVGATGYAGGDFLAHLVTTHPELEIRVFVRDEAKAEQVFKISRRICCILGFGSPDWLHVLETETAGADIVVQIANTDDEELSFALLDGVAKNKNKNGVYIHISGAGNLMDVSAPLGVMQPKVYGDKSDKEEILALPIDRPHAAIEQGLIQRAALTNTRIAIVSFPMLYGKGRGTVASHAGHFRTYVQGVLSHGKPFVVERGENCISSSHVSDASSALAFLIAEVLKGEKGRIRWGREGYYMVESSELAFKDIAEEVARVLHGKGLIQSNEIDRLDAEAVSKIWSPGPLIWGGNARARAERLRELGWIPSGPSRSEAMEDEIDSVLLSIN